MQDAGFFFDELTDFQKDLFDEAQKLFPDETKKFLKGEAKKLSDVQKKLAKQLVGTSKGKKKNWKAEKSYHKRFKVGKIYNYNGDTAVRAYNGAPHSHLIEYGHKKWIRGKDTGEFVRGIHVMGASENAFKNDFVTDAEDFLGEHFEDIGK